MSYCNPADVRAYLGIAEESDDAQLHTVIQAAQAVIDHHTGRTFEASADSTRYFDAVGGHIDGLTLWLDGDLCSITTVTNGDDTEVTTAQYTTKPKNKTPYYAIRILSSSGVAWTYSTDYEDAIEITGRWAYSTTAPSDIKQATIRLASYMYRQKDAQMFDVTVFDGGVVTIPQGLPADVANMLRPYMRRVLVT